MIDRLSIRGGPTPASCGYVLHPVPAPPSPLAPPAAIPPFKYTHYTFIRALNTSRIDGIERCTALYVRYICVFPSSSLGVLSSAPLLPPSLCPPSLFPTLCSCPLLVSPPAKANRPPGQRCPPTSVLCRKSHARLVSVCLQARRATSMFRVERPPPLFYPRPWNRHPID